STSTLRGFAGLAGALSGRAAIIFSTSSGQAVCGFELRPPHVGCCAACPEPVEGAACGAGACAVSGAIAPPSSARPAHAISAAEAKDTRVVRRCRVSLIVAVTIAAALFVPIDRAAARAEAAYTAQQEGDAVRLRDVTHDVNLVVMPSVGNMAVEMTVKGAGVLRFPYSSLDEVR